MPLSAPHPSCEHERRALRLAVELLSLALLSGSFCERHAPIRGDVFARLEWARARLLPLVPLLAVVRRVVRVLDWERAGRQLNDPRHIRCRLDQLAREVAKVAKAVSP